MCLTPSLSGFNGSFAKPNKKVKQKKTKAWEKGRSDLKAIFRDNGVTSCEGNFVKNCRKTNFLTFAHKDKRRNLTDEEIIDKDSVALLCQPCHEYIERMPHLKMRAIVEKIVKERGW